MLKVKQIESAAKKRQVTIKMCKDTNAPSMVLNGLANDINEVKTIINDIIQEEKMKLTEARFGSIISKEVC